MCQSRCPVESEGSREISSLFSWCFLHVKLLGLEIFHFCNFLRKQQV